MNKDLKSIVAILAIGATAMTACKKSSSTSVHDQMVGTWTLSRQYQDTNNNKVQDANELITDTTAANEKLIFNTNGTLTATYYGTVVEVENWEIVAGNYLKLTDTSVGSTSGYLHIESIDGHNVALKDTTGAAIGGTTWTYLTK